MLVLASKISAPFSISKGFIVLSIIALLYLKKSSITVNIPIIKKLTLVKILPCKGKLTKEWGFGGLVVLPKNSVVISPFFILGEEDSLEYCLLSIFKALLPNSYIKPKVTIIKNINAVLKPYMLLPYKLKGKGNTNTISKARTR